MTHSRFDNQKKKQQWSRTKIVVAVLSVVVVTVLAIFVIAPALKNLSRGPVWLAEQSRIAAENAVSMAAPKKKIFLELQKMKEQEAAYQAQVLELQQLRDENAQLRTQASYMQGGNSKQTVQVIGKPNRSLFNTIIIDAGSDQGIREGQLVTSEHNLGIGTVASVSQKTAAVELFGGPQFAGDVFLTNKNITVPATGKGSGNFEIHIPREVTVSDGDLLAFPQNPGIIVGVVKSIIFDARDPFQTVLARAPVNVQELRFVQVVK